jgi:hypothetical protein
VAIHRTSAYTVTSTVVENTTCDTLSITSDELTALMEAPEEYDRIDIIVKRNCCDDLVYTDEITDISTAPPPLAGEHSQITGTLLAGNITLVISPAIIDEDAEVFPDGIYSVIIRITKLDSSYTEEEQCLPLLCSLKCVLAETEFSENTNLHLAYFTLVNGAGCPCACDKMCELYEYILTQLDMEDGCPTC